MKVFALATFVLFGLAAAAPPHEAYNAPKGLNPADEALVATEECPCPPCDGKNVQNQEPSYDEPAKYAYEYAVADDYSGANFGQNEARDGYATTGEYRVALPDARVQKVVYNVADAYSGYVADVQY